MRGILLITVVALVATGCAGAAGEPVDPAPAFVVDADAHGAILFDGRQSAYRGVRRDGSEMWRATADANAPTPSGCLARCPDAVLSGSAASANSSTAPEPVPVFIVDGQRRTSPIPTTRRRVLTASGPTDFVLSTGDGAGRWWLEVHNGGEVARVPVGGFATSWQESADRRNALAITTAEPGDHTARWFARGTAGWQPVASGIPVAGSLSCLRPDGARAVLVGQRPTVLERGGGQASVTDLELAGTCALASAGGIVADLSHGTGGVQSDVRVFAEDRATTWRRTLAGEAVLSADPSGSRVICLAGHRLHEVDTRTGTELRTMTGIRAARYDRAGTLVIWSNEGLRWLD